MKKSIKYILSSFLAVGSFAAFAQTKVVDQEINITKEREITVPKATKLSEKATALKTETIKREMNYSFYDRKPTGIESVEFNPIVISPEDKGKSKTENPTGFNNYVKLGGGNYGRIFGEASLNSNQNQNLVFGLNALHNSTQKGPVEGKKSAQNITRVDLNGKYNQGDYELGMKTGYESKGFHFYGLDSIISNNYSRENLKQRINIFDLEASIENTRPKPMIDYKLTSGIYNLSDYYSASEFEWATRINTFFPLFEESVKAFVNGEAYLTQMSDRDTENPTRKRGLFRIEPGFNFDFGSFSARAAFRAVSQTDPELGEQKTKGYPVATLTYKSPMMIYFFAGIDGDIVRNTMRSMLNENPWMKEQFNIQNTYKNSEYYIGARGNLVTGLNFNLKGSYGKLQDLYYFDQYEGTTMSPQGTPLNVTKFDVIYDQNDVDFFNGSLELEYFGFDSWSPNLKFDYNHYGKGAFEKPLHRPSVTARLGNNISLTDKLVSSVDLYYLGGIYHRKSGDFLPGNEVGKLKDIFDLNVELSYLISDYLGAFVKMNNILGQNYQRFYNYPQLGLNFMAGINLVL